MKYIRIVLIIIFVCSAVMFGLGRLESQKNKEASMIAQEIAGKEDAEDGKEDIPEEVEKNIYKDDAFAEELTSTDLEALREINEDVLGWIVIPGTMVDYPLMRSIDNEFYLNHSWDGSKNIAGAIFIEQMSSEDLSDFHTIIYGHRQKDGTMFASLKYYNSEEYWNDNRYVYIYDDSGVHKYEVFSAYEASVKNYTYQIGFSGDESKQRFLDFCTGESVIETGITPTVEDSILTLSTCTATGSNSKRWVVQAKLVK
ncbi:MAG: class B sortase [Firmicutes bacterium]|nr:class B sortase [Bacillota bacterium]